MDTDLLKLLEQAGFTAKEARVYLALLELGHGDVADIANKSGLKRSIIYVLLEGLVKRGYASETPNTKVNTYQAGDPSVILSQLKTLTKNFSDLLPIFYTLGNKPGDRPKITYHKTLTGIKNIYEEMNWSKSAFFISSYKKIEKCFPGMVEKWVNLYRKKIIKISGRHMVPNDPYEIEVMRKFEKINQDVRYLPNIKSLDMDFSIYDNKLAITFLGENPFIVVMESEPLTRSMRALFEIIWTNGKKIGT